MTAKVKCVHCGEPVTEWTHECPKCGRPVANPDAPTVKDLRSMNTGNYAKKSIIPYLVALLLIIAGIIYYLKS